MESQPIRRSIRATEGTADRCFTDGTRERHADDIMTSNTPDETGDSSASNATNETNPTSPTNGIRAGLRRGDSLFGAATMTASPAMIEVYGSLGLDFAWVDLEHAGPAALHAPSIERLTATADAAGVELLLRIPSGDPAVVRKVLDCGARTILVPRVETVKEVRTAVEATRFSYDGDPGERGVGVGRSNAYGDFGEDYADRADETVCLGVMIETAEAVSSIEDIAAVPELGFAFLGLSDLSVSLGVPFEQSHPEVRSAAATVREACHDAGVPIGRIATEPAAIRDAVEDGYDLVRIGDDVSAVRSDVSGTLASLSELGVR